MSDPLTRLRDADPVGFLDVDSSPPCDLLDRIVAEPAPPVKIVSLPAVRRASLLAVVALALAGVAAVGVLVESGGGVSLAARAYAATAPADAVVFTQTTTTSDGPMGHDVTHMRSWVHGDRMHDVMDIVQNGKSFRYEHDQRGDVFRTLYDGKVDSIRADDPGWRGDEGREGFAQNLRTVVERFRARYAGMRDAGETSFNGRPARAYTSGRETFYVDRETALPLGSVSVYELHQPRLENGRVVAGKPMGEMRVTETVDVFERLPPTPQNLALLDAPAIDAAER